MNTEERLPAPDGRQQAKDHSVEINEMVKSGTVPEDIPPVEHQEDQCQEANVTQNPSTITSRSPSPRTHEETQGASARPVDKKDCRYCSQPIRGNSKVCHHCGCDQRRWVQRLGNTTLVASILISAVMMIMSYGQLIASKRELVASEKKELAATEALEQAKEARRIAQETLGALNDA